ncbi:hypothetical protein RvY_17061 [Ramazzottius varieornatus]|uniref:Uncharacterized protein n=1 Tax=Ramazzottius varieornatus TaxID=947166 RepID=A0A1D1W0T2_RAMVA|nr:hypothetical protein RvY_17061 [Ramazzottius varieornatus]
MKDQASLDYKRKCASASPQSTTHISGTTTGYNQCDTSCGTRTTDSWKSHGLAAAAGVLWDDRLPVRFQSANTG